MNKLQRLNWNSLLALLLLLIVVIACTRSTRNSQPASSSNSSETSAPGEISARALFEEYQNDKEAADAKYKDKVLVVTGTIESVAEGASGNPYVTMSTSSLILRVQFLFTPADRSTLSSLKKGQQAKIRGRVYGRIGNVVLKDCEVL